MKGIEKIRLMLALMLVSMKRRLPETRQLSPGITMLTLAGIVLLVAAGGASADTQITGCNFHANTVNERYYLNDDLICGAGVAGIYVEADGVIIDGQNHRIKGNVISTNCDSASGTDPCTASGIYIDGTTQNARNVVIKKFLQA